MPLSITAMHDDEAADIISLWQRAGLTRPWNDPARDIAFARRSGHAEILVGRQDGKVVASVMVGHDGHRGVVYYLAVDPGMRKQNLGCAMMDAAEGWLVERGVWKLNLMIRAENEAVRKFYEALGYVVEERVVMARRLDGAE